MTEHRIADSRESAQLRLYILTALDRAVRRYPEVTAAIAGAPDRDSANRAIQSLLNIDELQATAVLDLQIGRLTADQVRAVADDCAELTAFVNSAGPDAPE